MIKEPKRTSTEESLEKDGCENSESQAVNFTVKADIESAMMAAAARGVMNNDEILGSLSNELANIGHIDSSETSDDSPEGNCIFHTNINLLFPPTIMGVAEGAEGVAFSCGRQIFPQKRHFFSTMYF